jgi:hypothetical protein
VLDELSSTLAGRGLALSSLRLILTFEGGQERVEDVSLARPLRSPAPLVAILQERLLGQPDEGEDSWPPRLARIEALALNTAHPAPSQLTLFGPQELNHEKMTTLLARLTTTLGEKRVFTSELVSSHRPEAAWQAQRATFGGSRRQAKPAAPTAETHINIPEPSSPRPVFLLTPPRPLQGELTPGSRLRWEQGRGILRFCWGPERLRGQWWDQPFDRDYFVVDLHDGSRLWIYRDRTSKELFLQGVFD